MHNALKWFIYLYDYLDLFVRLLVVFLSVLCIVINTAQAKITYVKKGAAGLRNGTSWANAYSELDSALLFEPVIDTVWVTDGTYRQLYYSWGIGITDSAKVFGGFNGTETSLAQRNWPAFQTVIEAKWHSGSVALPMGVILGRSYTHQILQMPFHVRLDGFKVTGANYASTGTADRRLAPILISGGTVAGVEGSTAVIANCLITGNTGGMGAGVGIFRGANSNGDTGEVHIENCRFESNSASITGGAIFKGNADGLGAMSPATGETKYKLYVTDCTFKDNTAPFGGAIAVWDSTTIINRCTFSGNTATANGGAIFDTLSARVSVYNSVFVGNKAIKGAAHYAAPAVSGLYKQHTFVHNTIATNLNTETVLPAYAVTLRGATDSLVNSIVWDNTYSSAGAQVMIPSGAIVNSNLIQSPAIPGASGTFTFNPKFVSPGSISAVPFPLTSTYNYSLVPSSLAIDTAFNLSLTAPYNLDRNGLARVFGSRPDLGAYELQYCALSMTVTSSGPLTFCLPGTVTLTAGPASTPTFNRYYYWNGSATSVDSVIAAVSGTYKVIGTTDAGCRSSNTITVNAVAAPNPTITKAGNTLSVPAIFATYQWYKGGVLIPGANSNSYNPPASGIYTVKVTTTIGGCEGTSAAYSLTNLTVNELSRQNAYILFPNPATGGRFSIYYAASKSAGDVMITVTDITGKRVFNQIYRDKDPIKEINMGTVATGMYFVRITNTGNEMTLKIMLQ